MKTINYQEEFGEIKFPDGFEQKLVGKTLEEQMDCYRITASSSFARTAYGKITSEQLTERAQKLEDFPGCTGLVVKDGLLVGVLIEAWPCYDDAVCLPYECICTYYASDNEGSGTKDREDCAYLVCV